MPMPRPAPGTGKWWVVGVLGCALMVAVIVWLGLANTRGQVTWVVTSYHVGDTATVVDFDVHRDPGTAATCTVTALDESFGTVGTRSVPVPASAERSTHLRVTVRTTARAVTGTVARCEPTS